MPFSSYSKALKKLLSPFLVMKDGGVERQVCAGCLAVYDRRPRASEPRLWRNGGIRRPPQTEMFMGFQRACSETRAECSPCFQQAALGLGTCGWQGECAASMLPASLGNPTKQRASAGGPAATRQLVRVRGTGRGRGER